MIETLQCSAGHAWQRERVRGRKPTTCPKHKAVAAGPSQEAQPDRFEAVCIRALEALDRLTDPEAERKIDYTIGQLTSSHRSDADKDFLAGTLEAIIR